MPNITLIQQLKEQREQILKQYLPADILETIRGFNLVIDYSEATGAQNNGAASTPATKAVKVTAENTKGKYSHLTLRDAVLQYIVDAARFVSSKEIAEGIIDSFKGKEIDPFKVQVSSLLSLFGKKGRIVKYQYGPGIRDAVWGSKSWLDNAKNPIAGREPILEEKSKQQTRIDI